jgi:flagellar P-ring protein precursor FlgI
MNLRHRLLVLILLAGTLTPRMAGAQVRLKDIAKVQGADEVQLLGYGLIVGLDGTGDGRGVALQSVANLMRNLGLQVNPAQIRTKNVAAVMVTARLSPFVRRGSPIDVTVSSVGDAASLQGGTLLMTPLRAQFPDGPVYAVAQGSVSIGGFNAGGGGGGQVTKNHPVVGRVPNGATVQIEAAPPEGASDELTLVLRHPDYTTAARLSRALDERFGIRMAVPLDAGTVHVTVPRSRRTPGNYVEFIAELEGVQVVPDAVARVVINEKTGTIVAGERVSISEVAVAHGDLNIRIAPPTAEVAVGGGGAVAVAGGGEVTATEEAARFLVLDRTSNVGDVARALNALKVKPRDIISIFEALKEAGALKAELVIM